MSAEGERERNAALLIDVRGYAGPLDTLLLLARAGHVDLRHVRLAEVAEQAAARIGAGPLEPAAEALTLAAELIWLKSGLLLPPPPSVEDAKPPRDPAAALARRLAMRAAAERLMDQPRLGREVFARGSLGGVEREDGPPPAPARRAGRPQIDVLALLRAYAEVRMRGASRAPLAVRRVLALTVARALATLGGRVEALEGWRDWSALLAPLRAEAVARRTDPRSVPAAGFAAMLELARRGEVELRQDRTFGPIEIRRRA